MKQYYQLPLLALSMFVCLNVSAQVLRVKSDATGANNGSSWVDAYVSLDAALSAASPTTQVWVAAGTYKPSNAAPNNSFAVTSGVALYGGFAGTETALNQRNHLTNLTILSGDITGDDIAGDFAQKRTDNVRHVLRVQNGSANDRATVDGFHIRGGNTNNMATDAALGNTGGGILVQAKLTLRNCVFSDNYGRQGAGVAVIGQNGSEIIVEQCTFQNNYSNLQSAGVHLLNVETGTVRNCIFRNNLTNRGTLFMDHSNDVVIDSCLFENNRTDPTLNQFASGMYTWQSNFTLSNSTFRKNKASNAAGIYNDGRENISAFLIDKCLFENDTTTGAGGSGIQNSTAVGEIKNCAFKNNYAPNRGSAIANFGSVVSVKDCLFEGGQAGTTSGFGGAVNNYNPGTNVTFENCTFRGNTAGTSGGAIIVAFTAATTLKNCTLEQNQARFGGAIFCQNDSTKLDIDDCTFSENIVTNIGGALNISSGIVANVKNSYFVANNADTGGAIDISEDSLDLAVLNVENTTFSDNFCQTQAGAINQNNADVNLTNCLFSANINLSSAMGAGGAISSNAADGKTAKVHAVNCTFAGNVGPLGAGIAQFETGDGSAIMTLQNCIFKNFGENYAIEAGDPEVISTGGNLSADATLTPYLTGPTDVNEEDPLFVDLDNYDFHILVNSPAVDIGIAAGAPATDIEGNARINEPDAGCYENQDVVGTYSAPKTLPLRLSPNPATDFVQMAVENTWIGTITVEVVNAAGAVLRSTTTEKSTPAWQFRMELKDLPKGSYFAKARMGDAVYVGALMKH